MANLNNQNQNQTPRKKKKGGVGWLIFLLIIWAVNRLDAEKIQRFFSRLQWRIRTGNFRLDDTAIGVIAAVVLVIDDTAIGVIAAVVLVIVLAVTISRVKKVRAARRFDGVKARGGGTAAAHSHDRLQGYRGDEDKTEHWKKQLDGFLEAGIIDRAEYRVLLERRRR